MISLYSKINDSKSGASFPNINTEYLNKLLLPLPSQAEQYRIVQKVNELMQHCNDLEASIKQSESQNEKLLQQVLREALRKEPTIEND
jgi:type I restriction enzyme S subunit